MGNLPQILDQLRGCVPGRQVEVSKSTDRGETPGEPCGEVVFESSAGVLPALVAQLAP